jgi:hypothetical protein
MKPHIGSRGIDQLEENSQLHVPGALTLGGPETNWTLWRKEKFLGPAGNQHQNVQLLA